MMSFTRLSVGLLVFGLLFCIQSCSGQVVGAKTGGWQEIDLDTATEEELQDINSTALFALEEINAQIFSAELSHDPMPIGELSLSEIIEAQVQVVAGLLYNISINTTDDMSIDFQYNFIVYRAPWKTPPITLEDVNFIL
eukprot:TRINITY_DN15564_c0_g1_i4.p1 TRINITY_DN15564_c0_g1~~TRINITY_DN15564_c0_g1_i4.p1  ORF type:complete len:139 (+),score=18.13 TRINITY_DN15564_c0_g1_i4:129-545(+)